MARRKRVYAPDDPSMLEVGLRGLDDLIGTLRRVAADAISFSSNGRGEAYDILSCLLSELHSLAKSGSSKHVANLSIDTPDRISEASRIALAFGLNHELNAKISDCLAAMEEWIPSPPLKFERAPLIIGTGDEAIEISTRIIEDNTPESARIADENGREYVKMSVGNVLACLDTMRCQFRDKLIGKSNKKMSTKRSWTQEALDEELRQYKTKHYKEFARLKKAMTVGGTKVVKEIQAIFGRNTIVKLFGVRSPDMVTKSRTWQEIADELGMPRGRVGERRLKPEQLRSTDPNDDDIGQEFLRKLRTAFCEADLEEILKDLKSGKKTKSDVLALINAVE